MLAKVLLIFAIFIVCIQLCFSVFSKKPRPLLFMASLYFLFFYLVPGFLHLSIGVFPFFSETYSDSELTRGVAVVFLYCFVFLASYFALFFLRLDGFFSKDFRLNFLHRERRLSSSFLRVSLFCACFGLIGSLLVGVDTLFISRGDYDLGFVFSPGWLVGSTIARVCGFLSFLYSIFYFKIKRGFRGFSLLCFCFFVFIFLNYPVSIPRYLVGAYIFAGVFVFFRLGALGRSFVVAALLFGQVTVFPLLSMAARGDVADYSDIPVVEYLSTNGDFDGLQSTISVVQMTQVEGLRLGKQLLSAVFFALPRDYWPGKSIGTGGEAGIFFGYNFVNLSAPLPAEFYVDFGFSGLIVLTIFFAWFVVSVDRYYSDCLDRSDEVGLVVPSLLCGYSFIILRGSLVGVLGPCVVSVLIAMLVRFYVTRCDGEG